MLDSVNHAAVRQRHAPRSARRPVAQCPVTASGPRSSALKEPTDQKRGQLFTKLGRELSVAAREGGPNPDGNARLRMAIDRAREANMPMETIQRAIQRGVAARAPAGGGRLRGLWRRWRRAADRSHDRQSQPHRRRNARHADPRRRITRRIRLGRLELRIARRDRAAQPGTRTIPKSSPCRPSTRAPRTSVSMAPTSSC